MIGEALKDFVPLETQQEKALNDKKGGMNNKNPPLMKKGVVKLDSQDNIITKKKKWQ